MSDSISHYEIKKGIRYHVSVDQYGIISYRDAGRVKTFKDRIKEEFIKTGKLLVKAKNMLEGFIPLPSHPFKKGLALTLVGVAAATSIFLSDFKTADVSEKQAAYNLMDENESAREFLSRFVSAKPWKYVGNIRFSGKTSPEFHQNIVDGWQSMPEAFKKFLDLHEYKVDAGRSIVGIDPTLKGVDNFFDPTDERKLPNHTFGVHMVKGPKTPNRIMVTEYVLLNQTWLDQRNQFDPNLKSSSHGFGGIDQWGNVREAADITLKHEAGHAVNHSLKECIGTLLSDTPNFIDSYNRDIANMGGKEAAVQKGYAYFAHPDKDPSRARDEAFAQLFAENLKYGLEETQMQKDWPNLSTVVSVFIYEFKRNHSHGLADLMHYIDQLDGQSSDESTVRFSVSKLWLQALKDEPSKIEGLKKWKNSFRVASAEEGMQQILSKLGWKTEEPLAAPVTSKDGGAPKRNINRRPLGLNL